MGDDFSMNANEVPPGTLKPTPDARPVIKALGILARILGALVLLALFLFCAFGFLASFEPGNGLIWKVGYGALACGFLVGAVVLVRRGIANRGATRGLS